MSDDAKKNRPRTARRLADRAARRLVHDKQTLAALGPGGNQERPIEVVSSAVIEPRASSLPCPLCEGTLRVEEHQAPTAVLRQLKVRCVRCGVARDLWFRLQPILPN
jgi:hypothetical protein